MSGSTAITSFSDCCARPGPAVAVCYWRRSIRLKVSSGRARAEDMFYLSFRNWCIARFCCVLRFQVVLYGCFFHFAK